MENVERFLSSLECSSPTQQSYSAVPLRIANPRSANFSLQPSISASNLAPSSNLDDDFFNISRVDDDNAPLDAFDKELLAERHEERQWQASKGLARISLPRSAGIHPGVETPSCKNRNGMNLTPLSGTATRSSSAEFISSPTVNTLRNRQDNHHPKSTSQTKQFSDSSQTLTEFPTHPRQNSKNIPKLPTTAMTRNNGSPVVQGIPLVDPTSLPDRFRSVFPFKIFNAVQSKCFSAAYNTDENLVLSAPTGSGKTVVMELAICRLVMSSQQDDFKIVYQAPTKSLCAERCRDWQNKFGAIGLQCAELTGDTNYHQLKSVQSARIIVTTPEKWDSVTRKWKDHIKLMLLVKLFLIDEVHILKDARGATLEAVVSRMKSVGSNVRFIALSATVPNSDDIATWLGRNSFSQHVAARREVFGEEFRPVQLRKIVYGFNANQNDFVFDNILTEKLPEIIAKHSERRPILIFCFTRSSTIQTAKGLTAIFNAAEPSKRPWRAPARHVQVMNEELRKTTSVGVAFHHAGLGQDDRRAIENGFLNGSISIICCTSTLAVGVNLPCYLVIVKNTMTWTGKGIQEYPDLEMMQMLGRAGRPQFETSACAVILTRSGRVKFYEKMVSGTELLESTLHSNLIDHLNAEIGLGTVTDMLSAKKWLAGTFLFVRLRKNRHYYQLNERAICHDEDELLEQICAKDIKLLKDADLISNEQGLKCTEFGDIMARYCIKFDTMKVILSLPPKARISEILSAMAQAAEFHEVRFKAGEKSLYKEINKDMGIKFPIKVDLAQQCHKISLIIQSELASLEFPTNETYRKHKQPFLQDKNIVFQHVNRLIRCIIDCQLHLKDSVSARNALDLGRSLAARVWDNSPLQLKQLDQIGNMAVRKLAGAGITSIETLENTEPHRIESVLSKNPPFGMRLLSQVAQFPKLRVSVKQVGKEIKRSAYVGITINAQIGFLNEKSPDFFNKKPIYVCFIAETADGELLDFRRILGRKIPSEPEINILAPLARPTSHISCHIMCDEIAGTSRSAHVKTDHIPAHLFPTFNPTDGDPYANGGELAVGSALQGTAAKQKISDEFGDEGLCDGDLRAAELAGERIEVVDIDDVLSDHAEQSGSEVRSAKQKNRKQKSRVSQPVKLGNERWACNHPCKDKSACKHRCCKEGLDKPPKEKKAVSENRAQSETSGCCLPSDPKTKAKSKNSQSLPREKDDGLQISTKVPRYQGMVRETIAAQDLSSDNGSGNDQRNHSRSYDQGLIEEIEDDDLTPVQDTGLESLSDPHGVLVHRHIGDDSADARERHTGDEKIAFIPVDAEVADLEDPFAFSDGVFNLHTHAPQLGPDLCASHRPVAEPLLDEEEDLGFWDSPIAFIEPRSLQKRSAQDKVQVFAEEETLVSQEKSVIEREAESLLLKARSTRHDPAPSCDLSDSSTVEGETGHRTEKRPRKKLRLVVDPPTPKVISKLPLKEMPNGMMKKADTADPNEQTGEFEMEIGVKENINETYEQDQLRKWEEVGLDRALFEEFKDIVDLI